MPRSQTILALMASALCLACRSDHEATYPIRLTIVAPAGVSLEGGVVTLTAQSQPISAAGKIDAQGTCQVGTYAPGDGAIAGVHHVSVVAPRAAGDPDEVAARDLIDPRYANPAASGLTIEVRPDGPNEFTLNVAQPQP